MADYRWYDFQNEPFEARFATTEWVVGAHIWETGMRAFPFDRDIERAREWVNDIRRASKGMPAPACPRVFISHRKDDEKWARHIAWLAWTCNFDYWLDAIDLGVTKTTQVKLLESKLGRPLVDVETSILTAAIIEMALLNCTHVLAVMTDKTAGSQWVPYEYGRVKEPPPLSIQASCWWDKTTLANTAFPEYMYLGRILYNTTGITTYLIDEKTRYPNCTRRARDAEPDRSTPLPTG